MPTITGINHIALTVSDLTVSVAFYETVLGVERISTMDDGPFTRSSVRPHDSRTGSPRVGLRLAGGPHLMCGASRRARVSHSGVQDAAYGSALSFSDPDGNALDFFASA